MSDEGFVILGVGVLVTTALLYMAGDVFGGVILSGFFALLAWGRIELSRRP